MVSRVKETVWMGLGQISCCFSAHLLSYVGVLPYIDELVRSIDVEGRSLSVPLASPAASSVRRVGDLMLSTRTVVSTR